jgi:hypothetical protein
MKRKQVWRYYCEYCKRSNTIHTIEVEVGAPSADLIELVEAGLAGGVSNDSR